MSKTYLEGVNELLKQVGVLAGSLGEITSFTDLRIQHDIDVARRAWNNLLLDIYSVPEIPLPSELTSSSFSLTSGTRVYALASNIALLRWPLIDETNNNYLYEYPGGYLQLREDQGRPGDFTGLPNYAAIYEGGTDIYLDREPTSDEEGNSYTYWYDKTLSLTNVSDTFPFKDAAFDAMVLAASELWKQQRRSSFNERAYRAAKAAALRILANKTHIKTYVPISRRRVNITDPFIAPRR